jgi:poly-gamma-glutamate synthesis protein (capsule biosynthesis protein)
MSGAPGYHRAVKRAPLVVVLGILALAALVPLSGGLLGTAAPSASPVPSPAASSPAPAATPGRSPTVRATPAPPSQAPPSATPAPVPDPSGPVVPTAVVPVTHFRAAVSGTSLAEVRNVLSGTSGRYRSLELVRSEAAAVLAALGLQDQAGSPHLVLAADAGTVVRDMARTRNRLGFLRADVVGPNVRALAWGRDALYGVDRVADLDAWPLMAQLPDRRGGYDPGRAWTLVAGGDILLDRGVAKTVKIDGRGVDFPFDGGRADITSRYCCSSFGWELPRTRRLGNRGAMRDLLTSADLAIANFENPAPDQYRFHASGTVFSADPALIEGLANAGIDWVSLANNHIRDSGAQGILDTIENLDAWGIRHGGAGANLAAARRARLLRAGDARVAVLAYDTIAGGYAAGSARAGSARMSRPALRADVRAARRAGADIVIVFPHWGTEYDATPFTNQQRLGRAAIDAGADLVIGNHAHWAGAMEVYEGKPIWYALGNFVFDQTWSEPTMEGITLELTFVGATLRQVRMRPHIILDKAQPNFLDPTGDGRVVMGQVFDASRDLPW